MLLTNRRHRLLFAGLAVLEVSWYTPVLAWLLAYWAPRSPFGGFERLAVITQQPLLAIGLIWAAMLIYMLLVDTLNRRGVDSPLRELIVLGAFLITSGLAAMVLLHPPQQWASGMWIRATLAALFDFTAGLRPELIILLLNFFLWFRVATFTDRGLSFFSVGMNFRVAILLALAGNGLLTTLGGVAAGVAIQYFMVTIAAGLFAVALARIDDKAQTVQHSTGAILPWTRVLHLILMIGVIIVMAQLMAWIIQPDHVRMVLGWTMPVWRWLGAILGQLLLVVLVALTPFFEWLAALIQARLLEMPAPPPMDPMAAPEEFTTLGDVVDRSYILRYLLVGSGVLVALALIWVFLARVQRRPLEEEAEESNREEQENLEGTPRFGLDRLRNWYNLLRRYGVSNGLLAAVSVENIYANTLRLAARRGVRRPPAQAPDRFLSRLVQTFPQHEEALRRITNTYMRVFYGGRTITSEDLAQMRADYQAIASAPRPDQSPPR